jgi:hypothetical protein
MGPDTATHRLLLLLAVTTRVLSNDTTTLFMAGRRDGVLSVAKVTL